MHVGVDNAIVWLKIIKKNKIEQPGGVDSAVLRLEGLAEHKVRRGTITDIDLVHFPLEITGYKATIMNQMVDVNTSVWVIGYHRDERYIDKNFEPQIRLKIVIQDFDIDRKFDLRSLFES